MPSPPSSPSSSAEVGPGEVGPRKCGPSECEASPPGAATGGPAALLRRARAGDGPAFEALYRTHARAVHGVLVSTLPPADAEDLTQETFLVAWRRLAQLREEEHFGAWLVAIARNAAAKLVRSRRPWLELDDEVAAVSALEVGPPAASGGSALEILQTLPEAYREALAMRFVEGLSGPEIAALTGRTPGSVRVHLHRGLKLLRERLGGKP